MFPTRSLPLAAQWYVRCYVHHENATVLKLLAGKDKTLLVWRNIVEGSKGERGFST
jgi:hypothetical protein